MSYNAIICKVHTRPHPNADRLQLGDALGTQVILGLDTQEGELGVLFPSDGQISEEYCTANDLVSRLDESGNRAGGYFAKNRRVRTQKFRGEKSDGYWAPLSSFNFIHEELPTFTEGMTFDTLAGIPICNKYFTPATLRAINSGQKKSHINAHFAKHVDTGQFAREHQNIPDGSIVYITEKLHGTSGRFGFVLDEIELPLTRWETIKSWFGVRVLPTVVEEFTNLLGTRNVILGKYSGANYYGDEGFRHASVRALEGRLFKGESIYFELVGWTNTGAPIMPPADISVLKDKQLAKLYPKQMHYSYGCDQGTCALFVYRITRVTDDGHTTELSWPQVKARAAQLGLKTVPDLAVLITGLVDLNREIEEACEGASSIDDRHIREGMVLRVETPRGETYFLKHKSFTFKVLEGMIKEQDDYVDTEEAA